MGKHTLTLKYSFIFFVLLFASCGARKVDVQKTETVVKVDSVSTLKKEETTITQNNISINTDIDEIEIIPIDPDKPIFIGEKKFFNAKIKSRKTKKQVVDTTKKENTAKKTKEVALKKKENEEEFKKKVDKKESFLPFLWWILILIAVVFLGKKALKKYLL
jgi:hypothetical protein